MPLPHSPLTVDGRLQREQNEVNVLLALALFGHLRRPEVAAYVWPNSTPQSARNMVGRTLAGLCKARQVQLVPNSIGEQSIALTRTGARRVAEATGHVCSETVSLSSITGPQFYHRALGTRYLIERIRAGDSAVYGEYAMGKAWCPVTREQLLKLTRKAPDGLVIRPGQAGGYANGYKAVDWVEVESSYKDADALNRIFERLNELGTPLLPNSPFVLDRLIFVYRNGQYHESVILKQLAEWCRHRPALDHRVVLESVLMVRCDIGLPLKWRGYQTFSSLELLRR